MSLPDHSVDDTFSLESRQFPRGSALQFWKKASDREEGRKEGLVSWSLLPRRMPSPAMSLCRQSEEAEKPEVHCEEKGALARPRTKRRQEDN